MKARAGITTLLMVVVLVVVIVVAGVAYVFVLSNPGSPGAPTTTSTMTVGSGTSRAPTTTTTEILGSVPTSTGSQAYQDYSGSFNFTVPLGPSGINDSTGKPIEWNSTQVASGSFTFSINPSTYEGTGNGHGSITVTTIGYCTGSSTVPYTFGIEAEELPGTKNVSIDFNLPTPSMVMVQLACQGSTAGFNTANNPVSYLSVYPNGLDLDSFPANVYQAPTSGYGYTIEIAQTS